MPKKPQKPIGEMTTRELKKFIKQQVKKANTKLKNLAKKKRGLKKAVQEEINYLKRLGIVNKRGQVITGYRTARKTELQKKARELEYFNQWKGTETKAVAKQEDLKKYESFINNPNNSEFSKYSFQDWKDLVNVFGSMEDKLKDFEYEDMKRLHIEATQKNTKMDLMSAMGEAQKKAGGTGLSTEDLTDLVRSELFV